MKRNHKLAALFLAACMAGNPVVFAQETTEPANPVEKPEAKAQSAFSVNSYSLVNEQGEPVETLKKGEKFTLVVTASDPAVSTQKALEQNEIDKINQSIHSLNIERLTDDFSGGQTMQAILLSKEQEPLKVKIVFKDVVWKGKGDEFRFQIGYSALQIGYTTPSIAIKECDEQPAQPDQPDTPDQPADTPVDTPTWDGGYAGGGDDGYSSKVVKSAAPNLIVKKYSYGKDPIYSGKEFGLSLEFYNTSKTLATENIVVALETGEGLSIANSSNTFYFESLGAGQSKTINLTMKALAIEKSTSAVVDVRSEERRVGKECGS